MPVLDHRGSGGPPAFILDNGAGSLKAGFSNKSGPRLIPNRITKAKSEKRRAFIGDQIDDCRDLSALFFLLPFQRGYLVNWDHQKTVWDYLFGPQCCNVTTEETSLVLTEPYFNFASIREGLSEILFEEYRFPAVFRTNPADLSCYLNKELNPDEQCCLVVDSGYSFTHIVPFIHGRRVRDATVRIDVGGKLLTNHLKDIVSYRQIHVLDETHVMNSAKEDACYVSVDFAGDMRAARAEARRRRKDGGAYKIAREYVLPDFTTIRRGYLRDVVAVSAEQVGVDRQPDGGRAATAADEASEQTILLNNERFSVPELLFNPSDVGILQMGIPEAVAHCISLCDPSAQPWLYRNILLTGGNALFPNFRERVQRDVRQFAPDHFDVAVHLPEDPVSQAWRGGAAFAESDPCFLKACVSREEYLERGHEACEEKYLV